MDAPPTIRISLLLSEREDTYRGTSGLVPGFSEIYGFPSFMVALSLSTPK